MDESLNEDVNKVESLTDSSEVSEETEDEG